MIKNNHTISLDKHSNTINSFNKIFTIKKHKNITRFIKKMKNQYTEVFYFVYKEKGLSFGTRDIDINSELDKISVLNKGVKVFFDDMNFIISKNCIYNIEEFILYYNIDSKYFHANQNYSNFFIPYENINQVFSKEIINNKINNF